MTNYNVEQFEIEITPEMVEELDRQVADLTPRQYREYVKACAWMNADYIKIAIND